MRLVVFSKCLQDHSVRQLIELAHAVGFDGYDLCVRPGYPINPDNAGRRLAEAVQTMKGEGLDVPMVTGNFDLLYPNHPTATSILAAMDKANVRLLKLGYFSFDPSLQDYWAEVDRIRRTLDAWQELSRRYDVKICYHTHSDRLMGLNCAAIMHLLSGRDPQHIGAYIDPAHMRIDGEEFAVGLAMVRQYLSIVALKDVLLVREEQNGHGKVAIRWTTAGGGMVDWTAVFDALAETEFSGPLTVHCEFEVPAERFKATLRREIQFFKHFGERAEIGGE